MSETSGKAILATSLAFNCGFARVAVRELTETKRGKPQSIDKEKRAHDFKELFEIPSFSLPSGYFNRRGPTRESQFDTHCKAITGPCTKCRPHLKRSTLLLVVPRSKKIK